ncbi:MAG TPA: hypothetical protein VMP01_23135 [Pirellulaceae bacterium]|nr:hypothetical protein [Pirellulaceae bacterium]
MRRSRRVVETYDYHDQHGELVYRLVRLEPKNFAWVRSDGKPWGSARRRHLLYRLPELLAADPRQPVYVVEGEKDVDRLRREGLIATCNDNGAGKGKWSWAHSRHLGGRSVIIIPDNDRTGEEHAVDVARRLRKRAVALRIVRLPGLPKKGDVSDWFDAGGKVEQLDAMCGQAPLWQEVPTYDPCTNDDYLVGAAYKRARIINSPLLPAEKLLLIILLDYGDRSSPSQEQLAAWLGNTDRRVRQLIAGLQRKNALSVFRSRGRNKYQVKL